VIGRRGMDRGTADVKLRRTGERSLVPLADVARAATDALSRAP